MLEFTGTLRVGDERLLGSDRVLTESFRRSLLAQNKSPRTIQTYGEGLRLFADFVCDIGHFEIGSAHQDAQRVAHPQAASGARARSGQGDSVES